MAAATVLAVVSGLSTALSVVGAISEGNAQRAAANRAAEQDRRDAQIRTQDRINAINTAELAAEDQRREHRRQLATIKASLGSSGVDMAGSPLDVLADSAVGMALDQRRTSYEGQVRGRDAAMGIIGANESADANIAAGKNAKKSSYVKAGSALLSGASKAYGYYKGV